MNQDHELTRAAEANDMVRIVDALNNGANPEGTLAMFYACEHGNLEAVKLVYEHGADITSDNVKYAARSGNVELVDFLLAQNANAKLETKKYYLENALPYIIKEGRLRMAKEYIDLGADINESEALFRLVFESKPNMIPFCFNNGAVIDDRIMKQARERVQETSGNSDLPLKVLQILEMRRHTVEEKIQKTKNARDRLHSRMGASKK